jgi:hypothetical protein
MSDRHEAAGRTDVAAELRRRSGELTADRPLAAVRAAVTELANDRPGTSFDRAKMVPGPRALPPKGKTARAGRSR